MTENKVAVEQIDRDAAARVCDLTGWKRVAVVLRQGGKFPNDSPEEQVVQAFARHRTRALEASQPQEAARKPWYCELPDSVHAEVTKQVREIQAIAIRLDDQEIQVVAEAVYNALIAAALTTPIQAAESGLLDEAIAALRVARMWSDDDWVGREIVDKVLAKAGKPGEAGNG